MSDIVHVAVAVIVNQRDEVCISLRHNDAHQGGLWEFPGGKVEPDETAGQALVREIREELDLEIQNSRPLITVNHQYHDKSVKLQVFKILSYSGEAKGAEGQDVKWVHVSQLSRYPFPEANLPIINAIQLPDKYLITGKFSSVDDFKNKLNNALGRGIKLVQLRLKEGSVDNPDDLKLLVEYTAESCKRSAAKLMLNLHDTYRESLDLDAIEYAGFHADSKMLNSMTQAVAGQLFSASCHNSEELKQAMRFNADFVVLSPVQKTSSHPDMDAMGWQKFSELIENVPLPVFALGGVSEKDIERAWQQGAQGISAISALWE